MTIWQSMFAVISAIILFIYGLQGFSRELQAAGGSALQAWLKRVTENRWLSFIIGAIATVAVQSSSAATSLTVALVDAGAISFRASLSVLLGANVGTTTTAWLVAFKLTDIGPIFIVLGTLISLCSNRLNTIGKAIFYFGLIFFSLDLISTQLMPLQVHPLFIQWTTLATEPWIGVIIGLTLTAIIQSSSATTGIAVLLAQQGSLPIEAAIPIVIGANVGSTSTALLASLNLNSTAKATAQANFLFNGIGAILFFPFLHPFAQTIVQLSNEPGLAVAYAHLIFNITISVIFLISMNHIAPLMQRLLLNNDHR